MIITFVAFISGLICFFAGWVHAHATILKECKVFHAFYVGNDIVHVSHIETLDASNNN